MASWFYFALSGLDPVDYPYFPRALPFAIAWRPVRGYPRDRPRRGLNVKAKGNALEKEVQSTKPSPERA